MLQAGLGVTGNGFSNWGGGGGGGEIRPDYVQLKNVRGILDQVCHNYNI